MLLAVLLLLSCLAILRIILIIPAFEIGKSASPNRKHKKQKALVVLGSGGHTTEMVYILKALGSNYFDKISYIYSIDDSLSSNFIPVPRARKVGQSFSTSVFSTLYAFVFSIKAVFSEKPDIIICNGPSICVPVVFASYILKMTRTIYIESFARVKSLSLSGKILYPLSDKFVVQWKYLSEKYPKAEFRGFLV
ncbi:hypothetical protein BB560_007214 [Smittium megazygosporum]|uniref:UDP-N-acetylglucosamine transferase subunit ALG14 n=1 Tax=Smittium megazygosporum TaxID=133381 RepID=A0A2T9XY09_9FUNG|nr:hypothetical protein BB560_007214 [Smittium megazygosporum]